MITNIDVSGHIHPFNISGLTYMETDIDESVAPPNGICYYSFLAFNGTWLIKRVNYPTGQIRFATGTKNYSSSWTARTTQSYALFDTIYNQ